MRTENKTAARQNAGGGIPCGGSPGYPGRFWSLRQALNRDGVLELYIYGSVEGDSYDWWTGETIESDTSAEHFRRELAKYPAAREIEIYINSYGGEVFEGTAIYNQLRRHPARKTVYVDGFACSIASVIAMAGDEIVMPGNTMMMIHDMWMSAVGNAAQLRKAADDLDAINAAGRQAYLNKAGDKLSEEKLIELMAGETWLTAQQCVELGLADRIAETDADLSEAETMLAGVNERLRQQVGTNMRIAAALREMAGDSLREGADDGTPGAARETSPALSGTLPRGEGKADDGTPGASPAEKAASAETVGAEEKRPTLMEFFAAACPN